MKRFFGLFTAALLTIMLLGACTAADKKDASSGGASTTTAASAPERTEVRLLTIKGPAGVAAANLMEENAQGKTKNQYRIEMVTDTQVIGPKLIKGEVDIAAVPTNLAANLYNKDTALQMLAVTAEGVLYILENGDTVQKAADLKGKTVTSTGQGANPQYILEYLLKENGGDVKNIQYLEQNDAMAAQIISGDVKLAMVPEPFVSTIRAKNKDIRVALDVTEMWSGVSDGKLLMSCLVARKDFIDKNPQAVADFMQEYKASVDKTASDVDGTAALCEKHEIIASAAIAKEAIPRCHITWIEGGEMKTQIKSYFDVLLAANAQSIGGKLPDDNFYYKAG